MSGSAQESRRIGGLGPFGSVGLAVGAAVVVFVAHRALVHEPAKSAAELGDAWHRAEAPEAARFEGSGRVSSPPPSDAAAEDGARGGPAAGMSLGEMTESFRGTSMLMAIRDSGYLCTDIVTADPADADMDAWRVACDDAHTYLVTTDAEGNLAVDPVAYSEGLVPIGERFVPEGPLEVPVVPFDRVPQPVR